MSVIVSGFLTDINSACVYYLAVTQPVIDGIINSRRVGEVSVRVEDL